MSERIRTRPHPPPKLNCNNGLCGSQLHSPPTEVNNMGGHKTFACSSRPAPPVPAPPIVDKTASGTTFPSTDGLYIYNGIYHTKEHWYCAARNLYIWYHPGTDKYYISVLAADPPTDHWYSPTSGPLGIYTNSPSVFGFPTVTDA